MGLGCSELVAWSGMLHDALHLAYPDCNLDADLAACQARYTPTLTCAAIASSGNHCPAYTTYHASSTHSAVEVPERPSTEAVDPF